MGNEHQVKATAKKAIPKGYHLSIYIPFQASKSNLLANSSQHDKELNKKTQTPPRLEQEGVNVEVELNGLSREKKDGPEVTRGTGTEVSSGRQTDDESQIKTTEKIRTEDQVEKSLKD